MWEWTVGKTKGPGPLEEDFMKSWLRRIRGAVGMGLTWAFTGALVGAGIELIHNIWPNPLGSAVDIWPAMLAYPGFVGGVVFSVVLGIAARRRRFDELSLPQFALWGAVGGALLSLVPAALVALGLATPNVRSPRRRRGGCSAARGRAYAPTISPRSAPTASTARPTWAMVL